MSLLWGIDLGGTKIEGVVVDSCDPSKSLARLRRPTEASKGYEHILQQIAGIVADLSAAVGAAPERIGIGTPGAIDPTTERLKNSNTQCLNGAAIQSDLGDLVQADICIANDANCFALAEASFGAARGAPTVFGIILGTGVGGGIVVDGRALFGRNGIAGEWGHNVLEPDGAPCYCGKRGCVESCISGPALEGWYRARTGIARSLSEIVDRAGALGDPDAAATIDRLRTLFARALAVVINIFDPHVVVVGGGVSNVPALYTEIHSLLGPAVFDRSAGTPIVRNTLGDSAGVFGAALLVRAVEGSFRT